MAVLFMDRQGLLHHHHRHHHKDIYFAPVTKRKQAHYKSHEQNYKIQ
jgi:hypothetical protein